MSIKSVREEGNGVYAKPNGYSFDWSHKTVVTYIKMSRIMETKRDI